MSQEETKRRTYRFGEFEDLSQIVTPANGLHDWNTIKDWLEFYPFAVLQNWNSHWIKKPKEPLRAEFECEWEMTKEQERARDEAAITHANKYVAIPRNKLALETWQLSIRDDFKSGWDAAIKHQAEPVAGEFESFDWDQEVPHELTVLWGTYETSKVLKAGMKHQFNKDRERLAVLTLANKIHFENETALRARLARAERIAQIEADRCVVNIEKYNNCTVERAALEEKVRCHKVSIDIGLEVNEKLKRELAEKDALLVAKDNELCRALSEVKPLKLAIKQFKVWGTDGCRGKDDTCQGRLTLFIVSIGVALYFGT